LPNVGPYIYIYTTSAFLASLGAPYIYDISSLRVKVNIKAIELRNVDIIRPIHDAVR